MFKRWRDKLIADIAKAVIDRLDTTTYYEKFLPPVTVRDNVYFMSEQGSVYRMHWDYRMDMEVITKIRSR